MESFYIYEYIRLDTNEPFYIGKGKGNRWKKPFNRNKYFMNIINKVPVAVIFLQENLEEQVALEYECWYIWQYRDILGYNLVNMTDGGEGTAGHKHSKEVRKRIGNRNPMPKEEKDRISKALMKQYKLTNLKTGEITILSGIKNVANFFNKSNTAAYNYILKGKALNYIVEKL